MNQAGFTLLEIIVALAVLAFLAIGVYRAVAGTFLVHDSIHKSYDFYMELRLATNILSNDIASVYSPLSILENPQGELDTRSKQQINDSTAGLSERTSDYWGPIIDKSGMRAPRFQGDDQKLSFVAANHRRIYKETTESIFVKVLYELRDDEDVEPEQKGGKYILYKVINLNAFDYEDDDQEEFIRAYPILHGVKSLGFEFYNDKTQDWVKAWDSELPELKHQIPAIIKAIVEIENKEGLTFVGEYYLRPEMPFGTLKSSI